MKISAHFCRTIGTTLVLTVVVITAGCDTGGPNDRNPVRVSVSTDYTAAVPGRNITLVWSFSVAPGWHLYWTGRNDSGFAPTIDLELPEGWIAGGLQWPAPERHLTEGGILDHVYRDELVLLQKIGVPADASPEGAVDLVGRIEWLACKDSCVPGKAVVPFSITGAVSRDDQRSAAYTVAHDDLPRRLPEGMFTTHWQDQVFHVSGPSGARLQFMPTVDCGELVDLIRDGQGTALALGFQAKGEVVGPVRGLITIETNGGPVRAYIAEYPARLLHPEFSGG